jgi:hypothetical protein
MILNINFDLFGYSIIEKYLDLIWILDFEKLS